MTEPEAAEILFAIALSKRERADAMREATHTGARERRAILDLQAEALDLAIERLGGIAH